MVSGMLNIRGMGLGLQTNQFHQTFPAAPWHDRKPPKSSCRGSPAHETRWYAVVPCRDCPQRPPGFQHETPAKDRHGVRERFAKPFFFRQEWRFADKGFFSYKVPPPVKLLLVHTPMKNLEFWLPETLVSSVNETNWANYGVPHCHMVPQRSINPIINLYIYT